MKPIAEVLKELDERMCLRVAGLALAYEGDPGNIWPYDEEGGENGICWSETGLRGAPD